MRAEESCSDAVLLDDREKGKRRYVRDRKRTQLACRLNLAKLSPATLRVRVEAEDL